MNKIIITLLFALFSQSALAGVVVIVHPSNNSSFDASTISKIFLGKKKKFSNGQKIEMFSLREGDAISEEFNKLVLNKKSSQLKSYWSKLVFTGRGTPPLEIDTEAQLIEEVARNPSAIGFISSDTKSNKVKVVGSF